MTGSIGIWPRRRGQDVTARRWQGPRLGAAPDRGGGCGRHFQLSLWPKPMLGTPTMTAMQAFEEAPPVSPPDAEPSPAQASRLRDRLGGAAAAPPRGGGGGGRGGRPLWAFPSALRA